jgi:hypothetical protein
MLLLLAVCCTTAARADWTEPRPLWDQGILSGTQHFSAAGDSRVLDLDVDYAVFAPETFAGSLSVSFSPEADRAGYYVYAYQVYVNAPVGASKFSELQVGLPDGAGLEVRGVGYDRDFDASLEDIEASFAYALPDSVSFLFEAPQIHPGEFGVTLLYSSPMPPAFFAATVYDSGLSDQQLLPAPAPVPVPGAALLGTLGLVGASKIRRRIG